MAGAAESIIPQLIETHQAELLKEWLAAQARNLGSGRNEDSEATDQSGRFVAALRKAISHAQSYDVSSPAWRETVGVLDDVSQWGARKGLSPSQTAMFVFSLKEPLFNLLRREVGRDAERFAREVWVATLLLDKLGLYITEIHQRNREDIIARQQEELMELSTPVVELWDGILALPLIGTLDSERTQVVMENLLQEIVRTGAEIAIIDITGVPTVDTLVAQHLIKTIAAARLMGADCLISGIRPQIAQTIVHLGVELDVISKATMSDAFALALRRIGKIVVDRVKRERIVQAAPDGEE
jgi:rsbT co-antagonist protein RsbR